MNVFTTKLIALIAANQLCFATTEAVTVVNPSLAFYNYAQAFCAKHTFFPPGFSVRSADIGNGDISPSSAELAQLSSLPKPSPSVLAAHDNEPLPRRRLGDCSEAANSCQSIESNYFWCHYQKYNCMAKYVTHQNEQYTDLKTKSSENQWVFVSYIDNETNETQKQSFTRSETTTDTYTWDLSVEVDLGYKLEVQVGVPTQFGMKETFSLDLKTKIGTSNTHTETQTWSVQQQVEVPPRTTVKVEMVVSAVEVTGTFSMAMVLPYYAKLWCYVKTNGHNEWFVPANNFMPAAYNGICTGNTCNIHGPFSGMRGQSSSVKLSYCPLSNHC